MEHPVSRILALLELLQARPGLTGADIAERLDVDVRTVRRPAALRDEVRALAARLADWTEDGPADD
ncbi:HTH domain-containing protein [Kitasatospora purpeofusca]|uniref:HTH domain-containing protein n=1 Tax=Kitasatospora purpeofusca TaxID=67352 RepID=UPI0038670A7D|nr:helix-turn-helix domain-containing protein [Kitasatospora purpeofusca]